MFFAATKKRLPRRAARDSIFCWSRRAAFVAVEFAVAVTVTVEFAVGVPAAVGVPVVVGESAKPQNTQRRI